MKEKENPRYLIRMALLGLGSLVTVLVDTRLKERGVVIVNPGMAFGVALAGLGWWRLLWLVPLTLIYVTMGGVGWLLMTVGGVANLISGVRGGGVGDYWTIPYTQLHNNLPDWFIFVGFLVVIWTEVRQRPKLK